MSKKAIIGKIENKRENQKKKKAEEKYKYIKKKI